MSELHPISGTGNAQRLADVVFVHGLGGDAFGTWRHGKDQTSSWPHWLGEEFPEVGVWSVGYAASPSSWTRLNPWAKSGEGQGMSLPTRAGQLLDQMTMRGIGERPTLFIGHSLGGLVVKQLLRKSSDSGDARLKGVFASTRGVLFLGTPQNGVLLASLAGAFRTIFGATVTLQELQAHDQHLLDLYDWYRQHAAAVGISTVTYFEQYKCKGVMVVNSTTAQPGVGDAAVGLDEDHLSIAKPRDRGYQVCDAAKRMLREALPKPPAPAARVPEVSSGGGEVRLVPFELPPVAEGFVGRQQELGELIERLRAGKKTAVVGPAGMGKTALAARALREVLGEHGERMAQSAFPDGVLYLDLYQRKDGLEGAWGALADRLRGGGFLKNATAKERAEGACSERRVLLVVEGGEEADGRDGRSDVHDLLGVLAEESCWLLLTRLKEQALANQVVEVMDRLHPEDAALLFDHFTMGKVKGGVRDRALRLLDGHPLALTWAGNLLGHEEEDPEVLVGEWELGKLPSLRDPLRAQHTLGWLYERSVRVLDAQGKMALEAAGLLAHVPFPAAALLAVLKDAGQAEAAGRETIKVLVRLNLLRLVEGDRRQFTHVLGYQFARREEGSEEGVRASLGRWLDGEIERLLRGGESGVGIDNAVSHLRALLRADSGETLWHPLVEDSLYVFQERLVSLGRLGQAKLILEGVTEWLGSLPDEIAHEPFWRREQSVSLNVIGNVLAAQGDLAGSLALYRESLELRRRLAASDAGNAVWQRDLSVSCIKVGDVLRAQGDLTGALALYRESLDIGRRLARSDAGNAGWQRDVSVSCDRVGDVLRAQGDLAGALALYRESLDVARRLAGADAGNAGWQRDLSVSCDKVGNVLLAQGDLAGALALHRESLKVMRRLAASDAGNAGWQRDLSVGLTKMAQFHEKHGERFKALPFAEESLGIDERLAALDPSNVIWQKDAGISRRLVERLRG